MMKAIGNFARPKSHTDSRAERPKQVSFGRMSLGDEDKRPLLQAFSRRSRFSLMAKNRLSTLSKFRKANVERSKVSVKEAEIYFMSTRPHVWKEVPIKTIRDENDGLPVQSKKQVNIHRQESLSHREGELANFEEIQEFAPPKHTHYKDPMCFILNSAFIDAPKRLIVGLFWRFPKWLCTEVSKSQISMPSGLEAVSQVDSQDSVEEKTEMRPVPFPVFEIGVFEPKYGFIENYAEIFKSRAFGNQSALDVFGTAVGVYGRELVYLSTFIAFCALLEIPAMMQNAWMQPEDTLLTLRSTSWGLGRNALNMYTHGICDLLICVLLMMMVFIALLDENHAYKEVDNELLTMHDFSLEVLHPPTNNPDYYEAYFHGKSEYGTMP